MAAQAHHCYETSFAKAPRSRAPLSIRPSNQAAKHHKIKFATAGTIYIVIKAGSSGGTMGNGGINIDDVTFSEEQ